MILFGCQNCWQTMVLGLIGLGGASSYLTCKIAGYWQKFKNFKEKSGQP